MKKLPLAASALVFLVRCEVVAVMVKLYARGLGTYNGMGAVFLGEGSSGRNRANLRAEVLPLPLPDTGALNLLRDCFAPAERRNGCGRAGLLTNRDGGFYDGFPWTEWTGEEGTKREAFDIINRGWIESKDRYGDENTSSLQDCQSAYALLTNAANYLCRARPVRVYLEEDQMPLIGEEDQLRLGGLVELSQDPATISLLGEKISIPFSPANECAIEVPVDEAVGLAVCCGLPILVDEIIWERASIRPSYNLGLDGALTIDAEVDGQASRSRYQLQPNTDDTRRSPKRIRVEDIKTASAFQSLNDEQKNTALILANVKPPRPRVIKNNPALLDDLLLPHLDEAVRREVLIMSAAEQGDWEKVEQLSAEKSVRGRLRDALSRARRLGDANAEAKFVERLQLLSDARADPTQDEGSYDRYLDADEWYVAERRRAMGLGDE